MAMVATAQGYPELDLDPFSTGFLNSPYSFHEQLRDAGPVVWLSRYGIWAMARYEQVSAALTDWQTFCSRYGVGLADFKKEKPWRPPSLILEADPPSHTRTRAVLARILSRSALGKLRAGFDQEAQRLIDGLLLRGRFDGVKQLAEAFPLSVFPDAVGLIREGRENLLPYGNMVFNAFGPHNQLMEDSMASASPVIAWITAQCRREALSKDGIGAQIYAEADAGQVSHEEAALLVRSLLSAGLDTTIFAISNALHCFASNAGQWRRLRDNPSLARPAFEEVIRYASPVQTFFRTTAKAVEVAGVHLDEGQKVLLFLAAANRDPRKWQDPEKFDISRKTLGHVGLGHGIHACVGQMVARLEAESLLTVIARRVEMIELTGKPIWRLNNTIRGLDTLPLVLRGAQ
jgi:4-methoxybenzoate monooxygenase (O-demethylating)